MGTNSVREIQQALKDKGFDPGGIDGVWGRKTIEAVKRFQSEQRLSVDGIVGPRTRAALFGSATPATPATPTTPAPVADGLILPWLEEAKHLMGVREGPDAMNNPKILDWARDLEIHYPNDEVPWCGLFVAHCVGATLPEEPLPANPLGARQWERFGDSTQPRVGAVMVFWRKPREQGFGHVGFYMGEDQNGYQILGGNQSDRVSLTWIEKHRFLNAHWPKSAAKLTSVAVFKKRNEGFSSNEA